MAVHDVGLQDGHVYIVAEFLSGSNLGQWLGNNSLSWLEAAGIAARVADALAHAHSRLIVHRDVKPANIILTPERTAVLVDFGIGLDETKAGGRERGVVKGTPAYMSPEQVEGEAHRIDGRTDIYSLGVVLYEMLCGRLPFGLATLANFCSKCSETNLSRLASSLRSRPSWNGICLKALAKRMQDRLQKRTTTASRRRKSTDYEVNCYWPSPPTDLRRVKPVSNALSRRPRVSSPKLGRSARRRR